jgi:hypothetical protein
MFLYSPVPVLFPPTKKYYANLKQMIIVRQSMHHRTEWRSSQLPPIQRLKEGTQVEKIGPDFSRRSSPQIHANALPPSLPLSVETLPSATYTCSTWRNTVLGLGIQTLNQYPHNNPGVQRFRNLARGKKKKKVPISKGTKGIYGEIFVPKSSQYKGKKFKT